MMCAESPHGGNFNLVLCSLQSPTESRDRLCFARAGLRYTLADKVTAMSTDNPASQAQPQFTVVDDSNFQSEVLDSTLPVLVLFSAPWEQNTPGFRPVICNVAARLKGGIKLAYVSVDDTPRAPNTYNVRQIPLLLLFEQGHERMRTVGAIAEDQLYYEVTNIVPAQ